MKWFVLVLIVSMPALADIAPPEPPPAAQVAPQPAAEHPGGNANAPGMQDMGRIEGGWGYVYAAWGAGVFGVLLYGLSLFLRRPESLPPGAP
jgi:hypothetical protein